MRCSNLVFVVLLGALVLSSGCATVVKGTHQTVRVASDESVPVSLDGTKVARYLPGDKDDLEVEIKRRGNHALSVGCPDGTTLTVFTESRSTGAVLGNLLAGGLVGIGVDAATGANKAQRATTLEGKHTTLTRVFFSCHKKVVVNDCSPEDYAEGDDDCTPVVAELDSGN